MKLPGFWSSRGFPASLLVPLGCGYALGGWIRRLVVRPERISVPVICVGNLVAGGVGKTPVALALADFLRESGHVPHFLTRGYGGNETGPIKVVPLRHSAVDVGDEALLLAGVAPCWVSRDRVRGAHAAVKDGADILIMDDGFQNPSLYKDLSLVVVDGKSGFGNGYLIPAGPLRESIVGGMARADAMIIMGEDLSGAEVYADDLPVLRASLVPDATMLAVLRAHRVIAFAGIGRPEKFFAMLRTHGITVEETYSFADHYPYRESDMTALIEAAERRNSVLITTEKDKVRLPEKFRSRIQSIAVSVSWENQAAVRDLLERIQFHE